MALIKCPECGREISEYAHFCLGCGCPKEDIERLIAEHDAALKAETARKAEEGRRPLPAKLNVGDTVVFGLFEQDGNVENGAEAISWRVLDVDDGQALLISEHGLAGKTMFNWLSKLPAKDSRWNDSGLREWLEGEFIHEAFTIEQRGSISEVTCLSVEEAKRYFKNDADRVCMPTAHAARQGVLVGFDEKGCQWWLRFPGAVSALLPCVDYDGSIGSDSAIGLLPLAVRPVLRVEL